MSYCAQCQLVHGEEHRFCQRCGQLLKGDADAAGAPCTRCGAPTFPGQKFCLECGLPLRMARVAAAGEPAPERPPLFYARRSDPKVRSRSARRPGRILSVIALILVALGGVYLWRTLPGKLAPTRPTPPVATPQDDVRREVEKLAEKIRAAHLNKDINRWLASYHPSYPDLGRREREMLELWKNNDIKEVSYRISNVQRQGDNQASATISWNIQIYDHRTHDYTLVRLNYRVALEKTQGVWKIRDSKEDTGGAS
jgi:hypothetical protein